MKNTISINYFIRHQYEMSIRNLVENETMDVVRELVFNPLNILYENIIDIDLVIESLPFIRLT